MRNFIVLTSLIIIISIIHSCTVKPLKEYRKSVNIKVGIVEGQNNIEIKSVNDFEVFSSDGTFLSSGYSGEKCVISIQNSQPAQITFRLLVQTVYNNNVAQRIFSEVESAGLQAIIKRSSHLMVTDGALKKSIIYHIFIDRKFNNRNSAENFKSEISHRVKTTVKEDFEQLPAGIVACRNLNNGQTVTSRDYIRVVSAGIMLTTKVGTGFHFENSVTRTYKGILNFVIDKSGKLTVVNDLPIKDYLSSVVASEMKAEFPLEALKAQAVTARSFTLSKLGKQHLLAPFDICDDVHCQAFSGITKSTPKTDQAVSETAGKVLMYQNKICEAFYHAVCGGHTENNENIWQGTPRRYLRGVFDLPKNKVSVSNDFLLQENNVQRWVNELPIVYCNIYNIQLPEYLEYIKQYFRWEIEYTQSELSQIIREKTGHNVGEVLNIIPVERGNSGRLKKIRIIGTRKSINIKKDLDIRRALSGNYLFSSCFLVEQYNNSRRFKIKGAGWGHGVGMCQTGAAVMALKGKNYTEILNHYYREATIKSLY